MPAAPAAPGRFARVARRPRGVSAPPPPTVSLCTARPAQTSPWPRPQGSVCRSAQCPSQEPAWSPPPASSAHSGPASGRPMASLDHPLCHWPAHMCAGARMDEASCPPLKFHCRMTPRDPKRERPFLSRPLSSEQGAGGTAGPREASPHPRPSVPAERRGGPLEEPPVKGGVGAPAARAGRSGAFSALSV